MHDQDSGSHCYSFLAGIDAKQLLGRVLTLLTLLAFFVQSPPQCVPGPLGIQ